MKKRLLYYDIEPYLKHKNALVITGMRQVGKTTLMRQLFDAAGSRPKLWLDLDNPLEQKTVEGDDFRQIHERLLTLARGEERKLIVCIDEIQNVPEVTKFVKYAIDHYGTKFILTGSSAYYMRNVFPESLSGRKFLWILTPMTFTEYLYFTDSMTLEEAREASKRPIDAMQDPVIAAGRTGAYQHYMEYGGFPEVVLTKDQATKRRILGNILTSFFEKDIRFLGDLKETRELRDFLLLLVPRIGQPLDISKIAGELSVHRAKIYSLLALLEATFFVRLLPKYSSSIDRSVAGRKKVYIADTGLLTSLGAVNDGQLFENVVVNQLWERGNLAYYNRRNTSEIDIIVDRNLALEVKLRGSDRDVAAVKKLARSLHIPKSYVVSLFPSESRSVLSPFFW